jgi:hypothetical protein
MPQSLSAEQKAKLNELFARWNKADGPGLVVAVGRGDETLFEGAFGLASVQLGSPNTAALPLVRDGAGQACRVDVPGYGDISTDLDSALERDGMLTIEAGGSTAEFTKIVGDALTVDLMSPISGAYESHDLQASANIYRENDKSRRHPASSHQNIVVNKGDSGFQMSTGRTRGLQFNRIHTRTGAPGPGVLIDERIERV